MGKVKNSSVEQSSWLASLTKLAYLAAFVGGIALGAQKLNSGVALETPAIPKPATPAVANEFYTRKYYPADFEEHFGIRLIHQLEIPEYLKPYVESHDITKDGKYSEDPDRVAGFGRVYGPFIDKPHANDKRIYVKWAGEQKHYGVFADNYIPAFAFVSEYAGIMTNSSRSTDYEWESGYENVFDEHGNKLELGVDSQFVGNIARFVNHHDEPNCQILYIPWKGIWRLVYITIKPIYPGEELTISYGSNYWDTRTMDKILE